MKQTVLALLALSTLLVPAGPAWAATFSDPGLTPDLAVSGQLSVLAANAAPATQLAVITPATEFQPAWQPFGIAIADWVPGLGPLIMGDPAAAGISLGAVAVPGALGILRTPPIVFADQPASTSIFTLGALDTWFAQDFMAYQEANEKYAPQRLVGRRIYTVADLTSAPVSLDDFLDWRVWAAVAASLATSYAVQALPGSGPTSGPSSGPTPFSAKSASLWGLGMPPGAAYGLNVAGGGVMGEMVGVGEESAYRGVIQDEIEWDTGSPWIAVGATSVLFGLSHVGGINQTGALEQFLGTAIGGAILGTLYVVTGHDLRKDISAHAYYDALGIAINGLQPTVMGNNTFGVKYSF